jgi:hypothetical protein
MKIISIFFILLPPQFHFIHIEICIYFTILFGMGLFNLPMLYFDRKALLIRSQCNL